MLEHSLNRLRAVSFLGSLFLWLIAFAVLVSPVMAETAPNYVSQWGGAGSSNGTLNTPEGIAVDSAGNVYVADTGNHRIQKFSTNGTYIRKWGGTEGTGNGQFDSPEGLAVDSAGNIYVADTLNSRIQKFSSTGAFLTTWGTFGWNNSEFAFPGGVAVDKNNNIFVADSWNDRVQKFNSNGGFLGQWGGTGSSNGTFNTPEGIAVDSAGNVYVADTGNHRIQKFSTNGTYIRKWGGTEGTGNGQFDSPEGLAVDSAGNIYVADTLNSRIQKFSSTGAFLTTWGTFGWNNSEFISPGGVAVDKNNNIFVADSWNDRVQKFATPSPTLDTQRPTVRMVTPFVSTRISKTTTFRVKWSAEDPFPSSGMKSVRVYYHPSGSSKWRLWKTATASGEANFTGKAGVTYYFRTLAVDNAHNWKWSKTYKTIVPFNEGASLDRRIGFNGYKKSSWTQNYLSSTRYSYRAGHTLVYKLYNTNGIGLIVSKGLNMGQAQIYIDGKYVRTVDAKSFKTRAKQLIFYKGFLKKGTHYLKVVNLGTAGRAKFEVDAVVVGR